MDRSNVPYYKIAKQALMNWNGLSEEEADKVIQEQSFDEIEGQVWATGSVNYAIEGIKKHLQLSEQDTKELEEFIYQGKDSKIVEWLRDNNDMGQRLETFTNGQSIAVEQHLQNKLILDTLSAVHDGWVKDNPKKFFARNKKYQHLPMELIGWEETKLDLLFVKPIMESMGIVVDEEELKKAYEDRVTQFKKDRKITTIDDLRTAISKGAEFYPTLEGQNDIINALSNQAFVSSFILKEDFADVLKQNKKIFQISDKTLTSRTLANKLGFSNKFDFCDMIMDENYHLSVDEKKLCLQNLKMLCDSYDEMAGELFNEVYDTIRRGRDDWEDRLKTPQKRAKDGTTYEELYKKAYGKVKDMWKQISKSEKKIETDEKKFETQGIINTLNATENKNARRTAIQELLSIHGIDKMSKILSDEDLELLVEINDDKIKYNQQSIIGKKEEVSELTKREQLLAKLSSQEQELTSQEIEIAELDRQLQELKAKDKGDKNE